MHKKPTALLIVIFLLSAHFVFSQNMKFGKVSKEELEEKYYPLDSSANAAILYKKRRTYTTLSGQSTIQLITTIQMRLKIYNKEGFDWATKEINLYGSNNNNSEKVSSLKAVTYNLEGDKIIETKLDKKNIFTEEKSDSWTIKKFTMPNVKEGAVLEWSYKIYSPYYTQIDDIKVQHSIPVKKQDLKITLLEWFKFNKRQKGYFPFKITESTQRNSSFDTNDKVIEVKTENIPALIREPYVNNIDNYAAALQLEVASLSAPSLQLYENYATSWEEISKDIFKSSSFGGELKKVSHLKDDIAILKDKLKSFDDKVHGALQFVKENIKWNNNYNIYPQKGLKKAFKEHTGNIADINLTLVVLLNELGVDANPVLVSTRNNGIPLFPTRRGFNCIIVSVKTDTGIILLDASEKYSSLNVLPLRDLNWQGRIINKKGESTPIDLFPKNHSKQIAFIDAKIDDEGLLTGLTRSIYDNLNALNYRSTYLNLSEEALNSKLENKNNSVEIIDLKIRNKEDTTKPIVEMFKFETEDEVEIIGNKMYVPPMLFLTDDENPFKSEKREFPIDFGAPWEDKSTISIEIPAGYTVESLPEKMAIGLPENLGVFKFITSQKANKINILCSLKINTAIVAPQHYGALKEFYSQMIEKQREKIVLVRN